MIKLDFEFFARCLIYTILFIVSAYILGIGPIADILKDETIYNENYQFIEGN